MNTQSGTVTSGFLWNDTNIVVEVKFKNKFNNIPTVILSNVYEDRANNGLGRTDISNLSITQTGFSFKFSTWASDGIIAYNYIWLAMYCSNLDNSYALYKK